MHASIPAMMNLYNKRNEEISTKSSVVQDNEIQKFSNNCAENLELQGVSIKSRNFESNTEYSYRLFNGSFVSC